jgi:predicted ATPase
LFGRAGHQALQRSANADAVSNLAAAIDLLQKLPHGSERLKRELPLHQLAEGFMKADRVDEALNAVAEALAAANEQEERYYEAEIHRLKGELLLRRDDSNTAEAQRCFERAIEVVRMQSAKSWELRATTSLARLLASQGRRDEARAILADIYYWFTEGFDTADLKDAKALLDRLNLES